MAGGQTPGLLAHSEGCSAYSQDWEASTAQQVQERLPEMRDAVIMILSEKSVEDLNQPGGKVNLRAEIFRHLGDSIPDGRLMNVYFSDLVIQ